MIDFMVLSAPRSGSTWAANWLTTSRLDCIHDPVLTHRIDDLDSLVREDGKKTGISCTGTALLSSYVNAHPARKVIVHRDIEEINRSLVRIGLTPLREHWKGALDRLKGMHVDYEDLFDGARARRIWEYLTFLPFDANRHARLRLMRITPDHLRVTVDDECARDFRQRIERAFR